MASILPYIPLPLGLSTLRKRSRVNPIIVNYHMVSDEELPFIRNLYHYRDVSTFNRDLDFYNKYFVPIQMDQFLASKRGEDRIPDNSLLITFDDGFREVNDIVAPLLLNKGIPASFFINRDFVNNRNLNHDNKQALIVDHLDEVKAALKKDVITLLQMNKIPEGDLRQMILAIPYLKRDLIDQIAALMEIDFEEFLASRKPYMSETQISNLVGKGFTIGGHGLDHARFAELTLGEQLAQANDSVDYVVNKFKLTYRLFAFPYSDRGTTRQFFKDFSGQVDASFGTHGLLEDPESNHFQRISVEKYAQTALRTFKYHLARRNIYNILGRDKIIRNES